MGIEVPGAVRWLADKVVGSDWPDGDETAMRRLADDWNDASKAIALLSTDGEDAIKAALDAITGDVNQNMAEYWKKVDESLDHLADLFDKLSETLEDGATDIEHAKLSIITALIILAAELAIAAASLVVTFGTSAVAGAAAEIATAATVRMIIRELIIKLLQKALLGAAMGAAQEFGIEAGIQSIQVARGDRKGFDGQAIWDATKSGAVEGAVSGAFDGAGGVLGDQVSGRGARVATGAATGALGEGTATAVESVTTGDGFSLRDTLTSAATGSVSGAADGGKSWQESNVVAPSSTAADGSGDSDGAGGDPPATTQQSVENGSSETARPSSLNLGDESSSPATRTSSLNLDPLPTALDSTSVDAGASSSSEHNGSTTQATALTTTPSGDTAPESPTATTQPVGNDSNPVAAVSESNVHGPAGGPTSPEQHPANHERSSSDGEPAATRASSAEAPEVRAATATTSADANTPAQSSAASSAQSAPAAHVAAQSPIAAPVTAGSAAGLNLSAAPSVGPSPVTAPTPPPAGISGQAQAPTTSAPIAPTAPPAPAPPPVSAVPASPAPSPAHSVQPLQTTAVPSAGIASSGSAGVIVGGFASAAHGLTTGPGERGNGTSGESGRVGHRSDRPDGSASAAGGGSVDQLNLGLEPRHLAAIDNYTGPYMYEDMNAQLRAEGNLDSEMQSNVDDLSDALARLPRHDGAAFRGVELTPEQIAGYRPGQVVIEPAFSSSSTDPARIFPGNVVFEIDSLNGRVLGQYSRFPSEQEVLFDRNTPFYVDSVSRDVVSGRTTIRLVEMERQ